MSRFQLNLNEINENIVELVNLTFWTSWFQLSSVENPPKLNGMNENMAKRIDSTESIHQF